MSIRIVFQSSIRRKAIALHAWEPGGRIWDIRSYGGDNGNFTFDLPDSPADPRSIRFKFRFPYEHKWEPEDYVRRIPTHRANKFWAFDYSPRVSLTDPMGATAPKEVAFYLRTAAEYASGELFLWKPGTSNELRVRPNSRNTESSVTIYKVLLSDWMKQGFHFKCVRSDGRFEEERFNRVWRPGDGDSVYLKSGQVSLRVEPLAVKMISIKLLYPALMHSAPILELHDNSDSFSRVLSPTGGAKPYDGDSRFVEAEYAADIYPNSGYMLGISEHQGAPGQLYPLRLDRADVADQLQFMVMFGHERCLSHPPVNGKLRLFFHPRSGEAAPVRKSLVFDIGVGSAAPYESVSAHDVGRVWVAETYAPTGIPLYAVPSGDPEVDAVLKGFVSSRRMFSIDESSSLDAHTVDGRAGFVDAETIRSETLVEPLPTPVPPEGAGGTGAAPRIMTDRDGGAGPPAPPASADPLVSRTTLMSAAFGSAIAGAGIFDADEMPLGPTLYQDHVYFVIVAPHAVTLSLILISAANARTTLPMSVTVDSQYWWIALPAAQIPHGQQYRFLQNNNLEVLDPGARWASDPHQDLITNVGDGLNAAWSLYADPNLVAAPLVGDLWKSLPWQDLLIYKLHAVRFTVRNPGVTDGFDQVTAELAPGGYLSGLGATILEFLPVSEFDAGSWGYNPSLFFAINSTYGGPISLARCVSAAHYGGKGVFMDVVFNHYSNSPLQAIAPDVYVDGQTAWGPQVNYDNPVCMRFFRQVLVYLWQTFRLDGFRFDCTLAIIQGQSTYPGVILVPGSGGGYAFLQYLRSAVRAAADATGCLWPYLDGENDPNNWGATDAAWGGAIDGQWAFNESYPLGMAATCSQGDQSQSIINSLQIPISWGRPFNEAVRFGESQDTCGHRSDSQLRLVRRAPFGIGFQMAKAIGTIVLLADGVPMQFMGQEGGEDNDFFFDYDPAMDRGDVTFFARLSLYQTLGGDHNRIFAWFRDLMGMRNNVSNGLRGDDYEIVGRGNNTVAFTRSNNEFFVVAMLGATDLRQTLSWLGLPGGAVYKEILNSSWPAYQVVNEANYTNGSYWAQLTANSVVNLPPVGGVVFQRI